MILHHPDHYGLEKLDQNRRTRTKEISGLFVGGKWLGFFLLISSIQLYVFWFVQARHQLILLKH